jgi:hypothetical protein
MLVKKLKKLDKVYPSQDQLNQTVQNLGLILETYFKIFIASE